MPGSQNFFTGFHFRRGTVIHRWLRGASGGSPRQRLNNCGNRISIRGCDPCALLWPVHFWLFRACRAGCSRHSFNDGGSLGEGGSSLSPRPLSPGALSKNRRASAARFPYYHVLVGTQHLFCAPIQKTGSTVKQPKYAKNPDLFPRRLIRFPQLFNRWRGEPPEAPRSQR